MYEHLFDKLTKIEDDYADRRNNFIEKDIKPVLKKLLATAKKKLGRHRLRYESGIYADVFQFIDNSTASTNSVYLIDFEDGTGRKIELLRKRFPELMEFALLVREVTNRGIELFCIMEEK